MSLLLQLFLLLQLNLRHDDGDVTCTRATRHGTAELHAQLYCIVVAGGQLQALAVPRQQLFLCNCGISYPAGCVLLAA
jgi:hypothetical protein